MTTKSPPPILADPELVAFARDSLGYVGHRVFGALIHMLPYRFGQIAAVRRSGMRPSLAMATTVGRSERSVRVQLLDFVVPLGLAKIST